MNELPLFSSKAFLRLLMVVINWIFLFLLFPNVFIEAAPAAQTRDQRASCISPSGDDNNPGTSPVHPWRSITKINQAQFNPGDAILFERNGIWNEILIIASPGTQDSPVIFGAHGSGEKPAIDGRGSLGHCIASDNQAGYIVIDGLRLIHCGDPNTPALGPDFDE
jgi:hypothetical protein